MTSSSNVSVGGWSGRLAFVLASIGAAVGLGNIWKFPYTLGSSGGSMFVVIYIAAIAIVATPIMLAEMVIGRRTRASAPTAMRLLAKENDSSRWWQAAGWSGQLALLLVLSFYSVIAGWSAAYFVRFLGGGLAGLSAEGVQANFGTFLEDPVSMTMWHAVFLAATAVIVSRGVRLGLEKIVRYLVPGLFVMLLVLVVHAGITGDFLAATRFLFSFDLDEITLAVVFAAVGQAFFSVNVGVGAVLTYAAYLPKEVSLIRSAIAISAGDTIIALLAGLAIFPIVFGHGLDPAGGPGLVFVTLSTAFAALPFGNIIGALFFLMLLFAALTSSISMLEGMTARVTEFRGMTRPRAVSAIGVVAFLLGLITVFSFSLWADVTPLGSFAFFAGKTPFDLLDFLVSNLLMPLGGLAFALFVGWCVSRESVAAELGGLRGRRLGVFLLLVRIVAPLAIGGVFVFGFL